MRILITGASGFLGFRLSETLLSNGHRVFCLGRNQFQLAKLAALGADTIACDLRDCPPPALPQMDAVVHCAALSSPWGKYEAFHKTNVEGLAKLLYWCNTYNVKRFVHISTTSLYFDFRDRFDLKETDPLAAVPASNYTKSKILAEELIRERCQSQWVILRPRGIFGPGDSSLIPRALRVARKGFFPMVNGGKSIVDLTYVDNLVSACSCALAAPSRACAVVYNISNGEPISVREFFDALMLKLKLDPKRINISLTNALKLGSFLERSYQLLGLTSEPPLTRYTVGLLGCSQTLDISKARNALGYSPKTSLLEGLDRTISSLDARH